MIQSVRISQKVLKARVSSGARQTFVSIKSGGRRVRAVFVGRQGPKGADGEKFFPTTATRFTSFVGNAAPETEVSDSPIALPLAPSPSRTVERGMANWWNAQAARVHPEAIGDAFRLRVTVLARPVNPVSIPILICEINIAADGDAPRVITAERQPITGGGFQEVSFNFEAFAGAIFLMNGGRISLRSFGGSVIIKDPRLLIKEG